MWYFYEDGYEDEEDEREDDDLDLLDDDEYGEGNDGEEAEENSEDDSNRDKKSNRDNKKDDNKSDSNKENNEHNSESPDAQQNEGMDNVDNASESPNKDKIHDDLEKKNNELDNNSGNGQNNADGKSSSQGQSQSPTEGGQSATSQAGSNSVEGANASGAGNAGAGAAETGGEMAGTSASGAAGGTAAGAGEAAAGSAAGTSAAGASASAAGASAAGGAAGGAAAGGAAAGAGALSVVLFWVIVAIVIIILLVGLVCFFIFMPGQVVEKLKKLGKDFLNFIQAKVEGQENIVSGEEIADVANYLEKMGYDLKGEGFVSSNISVDYGGKEPPDNYVFDPEQWVYRDKESQDIVAIQSNPIKTYLVSDNLCYIVKNANQNVKTAVSSNPVAIIASVAGIIAGFVVSPVIGFAALFTFVAITGGNPDWGTGLISIYHEDGGIGKQGSFYADIERGSITLEPNSKKLKIKRGWTNNAYSFDVDGWSGRYGMPLEFLLSIHVATQMPDLAIDIATSFNTDVKVLLHEINGGEVTAGIKKGSDASSDDDFITWDDVMKIVQEDNNLFQDAWNAFINFLGEHTSFVDSQDFQAYRLTDMNYYKLFEAGFPHVDTIYSDEEVAEGEDPEILYECTCCSHIPGSRHSSDDEECAGTGNLDDEEKDFDLGKHEICDNCKVFAQQIISALKAVEDKNWNSYTPYIASVTDHWFRDVYFVIDDLDDTQIAINDDEYYYQTNERWSVYETWQEGEDIPEGFEIGDYKLYKYWTTKNAAGNLVEHYELSTLNKEESDKINEKIASGDTSENRLVKKLLTKKVSDIRDDEGKLVISGIDDSKNRWTAYSVEGDAEMPWTKLEVTEDSKDILKDPRFSDRLYYKENRPGEITQIEDGQRGATNPKIKKMFVENKYYQYDGTQQKANFIAADRKAHNSTNYQVKKNNTSRDERNQALLGKVSIDKDSLTAFSMLENTHTLDADYIYKDFKELIVELNYFDKEELSDKISEVMQWPLPETGSTGWPLRKYEKSDVFYGTLINSKVDVTLLKQGDIEAAEQLLGTLKEEDGSDADNSSVTATGKVASGSVKALVNKGYEVHKIMEDDGNWDYCINSASDPNGQHMFADCSNTDTCGRKHCDTKNSSHTCGLSPTIQQAQSSFHNTCCATFVSWVLKEAGFDLSNHPNMNGAQATYNWCKSEGWTPITSLSEMEPGDLLFNHGDDVNSIGHVQMLGDNGEWLNGGSVSAINNEPKSYTPDSFIIAMRSKMTGTKAVFEGYKPEESVVSPITGRVLEYGTVTRTNVETGEDEEVEFIKIEALNKYIYNSGKGYKECKKEKDTFEDKASDEAKLLEGYDYFFDEYGGVLDGYVLYMEGFDLTLFDEGDSETSFSGKETYESGDLNLSNYEKRNGGSLKLVKSGTYDMEDVSLYIENEVGNMTDDLQEARSIWKEDAKASALPLVEINGELYIKEGTIIGKTYEDPEDMSNIEIRTVTDAEGNEINTCSGNGNYIRLILRNLDDSIVEDVESYLPIDDETNIVTVDQPYEAQEGDLELLANLLHHEGCQGYFKSKLPEDQARDASRTVGYVVINRALLNYGSYGTTIREQILAPGQYSTASTVTSGTNDYCEDCLANAEWCLKYDCGSVVSPTTYESMTRNIVGQSGWCQCSADVGKFNCWWWIDTNQDGEHTEYTSSGVPFDTFYCKNTSFPEI